MASYSKHGPAAVWTLFLNRLSEGFLAFRVIGGESASAPFAACRSPYLPMPFTCCGLERPRPSRRCDSSLGNRQPRTQYSAWQAER